MEIDMLGMAIKAAEIMADPTRLAFLTLGVLIGLVLGVIPGLGGLVGLSLLLPFTFNMDPYTALAFLMGLQAVVVTSDTIPAVLFGVPGTVGSAATILDGYPMARNGEAGRAFGAAFTASVFGGLFGALLLALSVPILRPLLFYIETPEVLAFVVLGLSLVAVLSGSTPVKGLAAGCIGLMMATAGDDSQTGTLRWTFDSMYLFDGFNVVPIALGLFALPELADMAINRKSIAGDNRGGTRKQQIQGVFDVFRHWYLVIRCSAIGVGLGAIPGIGASVIDWIAYAHAIKTEKNAESTFGKGDVRGVIASESSNNAKEGGALIPTIAFGVPGTASMALLLGAFLIHGLNPGPDMLTKHLDVTYTLVFSIAIANIIGAGICFAFADQLAKIALVRIGILAPVIIAITFVGAFQGSKEWGDLFVLLGLGMVGWTMKRLRWPRPPLILGFVLGDIFENSMFISVERYGYEWLTRPIVVVLFAVTLYGIFAPALKSYLAKRRIKQTRSSARFQFQKPDADTVFSLVLLIGFAVTLYVSSGWDFGAKLVPQVIGWAAVGLTGYLLVTRLFLAEEPFKLAPDVANIPGSEATQKHDMHFDITADYGDLQPNTILGRAAVYFAWCLFFLAAAAVVGLLPAMLLYLIGYIRFEGKESWTTTLAVAAPVWGLSYLLFHKVLIIPWPQALLGDWLPFLRSSNWLNLL
ncbi:MAG: tripartite tricarboxylate transporter permease [Alphaproteobacteria bacterium]|nr:tripartite tricarboxylate transporter permease [Alphaproteobacteria bacterium]